MNEKAIRERLQALLALPKMGGDPSSIENVSELQSGATTLIEGVHGPSSRQLEVLNRAIESAKKAGGNPWSGLTIEIIEGAVRGALRNLQAEIDGGLIGSISRGVSGEVLGDLLGLAKMALQEKDPGSKNVAAVLAAAAYEDTIRRMGETLAGVNDRRDLQGVITALKNAGILKGPQLSVTQAHLKFRNDALHADWDKIDRSGVSTAIELTQSLLLQHFH